jgi:hypothetical protein
MKGFLDIFTLLYTVFAASLSGKRAAWDESPPMINPRNPRHYSYLYLSIQD